MACRNGKKIPRQRLYEMGMKLYVIELTMENEVDVGKATDDKGNDDGGGDDKGNPGNDDETDDLYDSDDEMNHLSKPAEDTKQQTPKTSMPKITGSKIVNMELMTEDVMNQGSIMVQMMSEQA